ncbi:MAG: SPOR domain-containing protein [Spirochaetaceae bacterium]|nr:SPOR domain-containing protein [Spirochaetaceae bacterium]
MEQKRILWIVASVGLFLLVVVGFALILYSPTQRQDPVITNNQSTNDIWASTQNVTPINPNYQASMLQGTPLENTVNLDGTQVQQGLNPTQSVMGQQTPQFQGMPNQPYSVPNGNNVLPSDSMTLVGQQQVKDVTVISENTKVITSGGTTIDLTGLTVNSTTQPVVTQNTNTTSQTEKTVVATSNKQSSPTAKVESAKTTSTKNTTTAKASSTTKTASAKTTTPAPITHKFWIQAGSYSSKKNAEEARNALSAEKIASEIFTYTDSNGTLFYRVRVGPYTTKSEAEYWQSRIALIDKFSSSKTYITDSSAKKQ